MEFFEKAHVVNSKESIKSKEKVKTQLKQMLHGYKYNDNELVSRSAEAQSNLDDSSSVSGFSDLSLTDYSSEDEKSQKVIQASDISIKGATELSPTENIHPLGLSKIIEDSRELDEETMSDISITELKEGNTSLTEDLVSLQSSEPSILSHYLSESSVSMSIDTEESDFDADGALALKIMKNLKLKQSKNKSDKIKKRTLKKQESNASTIEPRNKKSLTSSTTSDDIISDSVMCEDDDVLSSQPYESVLVSEGPVQSLSDLLGDYIHPTVRNITIENNESLNNIIENLIPTNSITEEILINDDDGLSDLDSSQCATYEADNDYASGDDVNLDELDTNSVLNDSTNVNDHSVSTETVKEREPSTESTDNTIVNSVRVFYGKKTCIFVMKHPAVIYLHGKVKIAACGGTVEILGHLLNNVPCEVFAPNHNVALSLKTVEKQNSYYGLFSKLTSSGLSVAEAEDIVTTIGPNDGIISLEPVRSPKIEYINNTFTVTNLFKNCKIVENCFRKASEILGCSLYLTKPWKCYEESTYWKQALRFGLVNKSRGIVCGGKGTGKSIFMLYYVNKMLEKGPLLVIDLDPGQCEFTVAGNISATVVHKPLLGPSYTHLLKPNRMLNIGMINTMDNTNRYMNAVGNLITFCNNNKDLRELPWIVNTMGMSNGMGLKFMVLTILNVKPTFLMQIDGKNAKKNFECRLNPNTVRDLYQQYGKSYIFRSINPPDDLEYSFMVAESVSRGFSLAPRDNRYLNFLSYFSSLVNNKDVGLLDVIPYEVRLHDLKIAVNVNVDKYSIAKVINGKVVALCQHRDEKDNRGNVVKLKDNPMLCYGHGLIRGIDNEKGLLYIITPVDIKTLSEVNSLVYADWTPEMRGYEQQLGECCPVPYRTASRYHQRQLMFPPRRRFNPLQLLKMNRSS